MSLPVKMKVTRRVEFVANKTGKSTSTIWRWAKAGCDLNSPASIKQFLQGNRTRQIPNTPIRPPSTESVENGTKSVGEAIPDLNLELGPIGKRGAAAVLQRLEEIEERAHARLMRAIEIGNPFQVKAAQEFYLRSSETLRRLDLAVETERRKSDEQVPKALVEDCSDARYSRRFSQDNYDGNLWLKVVVGVVCQCRLLTD